MSEPISHRLSEKNFSTMTATCSVCGPVPMRSRGKGRMACGKKIAEKHARWARGNPQKASRNRNTRSAHKLASFDASTHTGLCPVCGPVGVIPKGRGWMCETRAKELWSIQQSAPQERCRVCRRAYLSADGTCRYCTDREHQDWAFALADMERKREEMAQVRVWTGEHLDFVIDPHRHDLLSVEGEHVANPELKTIGAGVPKGTRPQKFIDQWWAENAHLVEEAL